MPGDGISALFSLLCALSVLAVLVARSKNWGRVHFVGKVLASTAFLCVALQQGALDTNYGRLMLSALIFSWWGDVFLISSAPTYFLLGLGSFLLAHLVFAGAFVAQAFNWSTGGIALTAVVVATAGLALWIIPAAPKKMRPAVLGYFTAISVMMATALCASWELSQPIFAVGAVLFCASDVAVARQRFMTQSLWNPCVGLPLYYGAQLIFAYSVAS